MKSYLSFNFKGFIYHSKFGYIILILKQIFRYSYAQHEVKNYKYKNLRVIYELIKDFIETKGQKHFINE